MSYSNYQLNQKINNLQQQINNIPPPSGDQDLTSVLTIGNNAGGLNITNLNDLGVSTINGSVYPPVIPTDTLTSVLIAGNSAGASNINMNNNDILNVDNINLTTINNSAYPPVIPTDTLTSVLIAGNSAGASDINMNNNDILNVDNINLTTINNSAYPPVIPTDTLQNVLIAGNTATGTSASISLTNLPKQTIISPTSVFLNDTTIVQQATLNTQKLRLLTSGITNDITSDKISIIKPATSSISEYGTDGISLSGLFGAETRSGGFNLNTGLTTTNATTKLSGTLNEAFVSLDGNTTSSVLGNKSTLNATGLTCVNKVTPSTTSSLSATALNLGITGTTLTVSPTGLSSTNILNLNSSSQIDINCPVRVRANPATTESATLTSGQLSMKNTNNTLQNNISSTSMGITNGTKTISMTVDGISSTGAMSLGTATVNLTTGSTGITQTYPSNTTALATTAYVSTAISNIPAPAVPTLQSVLNAGNTANETIILSKLGITNDIRPNKIIIRDDAGTEEFNLSKDSLIFTTTTGTNNNFSNSGAILAGFVNEQLRNCSMTVEGGFFNQNTVNLKESNFKDDILYLIDDINKTNRTISLSNGFLQEINNDNLVLGTKSLLSDSSLTLINKETSEITTIIPSSSTITDGTNTSVIYNSGIGFVEPITNKSTYYNLNDFLISKTVGNVSTSSGSSSEILSLGTSDSVLLTSSTNQLTALGATITDGTYINALSSSEINISNGTNQSLLTNEALSFTLPTDVFGIDATDFSLSNTGGTISNLQTKNSLTLTENTGTTTRTITLSNPTIGNPTILLDSVDETNEMNNTQINIYNLSTDTQSYLTRTQLQLTSTTTDATMTKDDLIMTEAVVFPAVPAINTINRTGMTLSNSIAKAVYDTSGLVISNLANTINNTISKFGSSLIDIGKSTFYNLDGFNIQKIVGPITNSVGAQSDFIGLNFSNSSLLTSNNLELAPDHIFLSNQTTSTNTLSTDDIQISDGTIKTTFTKNTIVSTDNLTINSAPTKILKIGSGSATENVEISTQAGRSVVLHLGDGINNIAGSGVHINNGVGSIGNTQINNGSGQTGTINIGNATLGTTTTNIAGTTNIGNSGSTTTTIGIQSSTINMRGGININNSATGGYSGTNIGINGSVTAINGTTNINTSSGGTTTIGTAGSSTSTIQGATVNVSGTTNAITGTTNINTTGNATTTIGGTGTGAITIGTATTTSTNLVGTQVNLTNPRINQPITMLYSTVLPAIGVAGLNQIGGTETYRNNAGGNGFFTTTGTTKQVYAFINSIPTGRYIVNSALTMNTLVVSTTVSMRTVYNTLLQPLTINQTLTLGDTPANQAIEIEGLKPNATNKYSLQQAVVMDISSAIGNQVGMAITFGTANVGVLNGFSLYLNLTVTRIS